ncbi:MAG: hypothetical protein QGM50_01640 [Anaerolineae bacterium]|nr:hypothetical protein [Anaerolineae bacterium]
MEIVQAPRASAILYNILINQANHDPWLLPANICPIVPITFFKAEVSFEFVDISGDTLQMDLKQVEGRLKRAAYGGILYAHTYGVPSTPDEFLQSVKSKFPDLLLIDDRCLCNPDLEPNPVIIADVVLYSTGYAKVVDLNSGGYAFINDNVQYHPVDLPHTPSAYIELEQGYKQAIKNRTPYIYNESDWLQTQADFPTWYDYRQQISDGLIHSNKQRNSLNSFYADHLPAEIQLSSEFQSWRFNIRLKNKDKILNAIFAAGLFASSHYASLAGIMAPGECTQAESLANEIINLFNDRHFDLEKADQVCKLIRETLA